MAIRRLLLVWLTEARRGQDVAGLCLRLVPTAPGKSVRWLAYVRTHVLGDGQYRAGLDVADGEAMPST